MSSSRVYAYGKPAPEWLNRELLLSQSTSAGDRHAAYRKITQKYAGEEGRLWEDLHHGFLLGTEQFVDAIKGAFLLETPHREMPQQKQMSVDVDLKRP